jgi:hypothetical protein
VTWSHVWESKEDLSPTSWAVDSMVPPTAIAVPGKTKLL